MKRKIQILWLGILLTAFLTVSTLVAAELPKIVVLATGGTIAGAAASDVQAGRI